MWAEQSEEHEDWVDCFGLTLLVRLFLMSFQKFDNAEHAEEKCLQEIWDKLHHLLIQ